MCDVNHKIIPRELVTIRRSPLITAKQIPSSPLSSPTYLNFFTKQWKKNMKQKQIYATSPYNTHTYIYIHQYPQRCALTCRRKKPIPTSNQRYPHFSPKSPAKTFRNRTKSWASHWQDYAWRKCTPQLVHKQIYTNLKSMVLTKIIA